MNSLSETSVVVLEDSAGIKDVMKLIIEDEFKGHVEIANTKEDVVDALENRHVSLFILDNCVGDNRHEGLDALERVRLENKTAFVAIFSAFPRHKKQALMLGCNLFVEKSPDLKSCVQYIAREMLQHQFELSMKKVNLEIFKRPVTLDNSLLDVDVSSYAQVQGKNGDCNISQYEKLKLEPAWLRDNLGKYAAFVDGKWLKSSPDDSDESKEDLFGWLINEKEFHNKQRFFTKVEIDHEVMDEPSSLWFDE